MCETQVGMTGHLKQCVEREKEKRRLVLGSKQLGLALVARFCQLGECVVTVVDIVTVILTAVLWCLGRDPARGPSFRVQKRRGGVAQINTETIQRSEILLHRDSDSGGASSSSGTADTQYNEVSHGNGKGNAS